MTLKIRRILSLIFILLFFTTTPVIMLYAAGYKLGQNLLSIKRTGMFIVDSEPRGATIFINGEPVENWSSYIFNKNNFLTTPAKIKNILPGEYDVKVELNGYLGWEKKLTIAPGAATFAENIFLFKNGLPTQIMPIEASAISFSPDKSKAIATTDNGLTVIKTADESNYSIEQKGLKGDNVSWSQDGNGIVVNNYLFYLNDKDSKINLKKISAGAENYKWSNNTLYFQSGNSIMELTGENSAKKIISGETFSDFIIKGANLVIINQAKSSNNLVFFNLKTGEKIKEIILPGTGDYFFVNPDHTLLNIYDSKRKIAYLVNPEEKYFSPLVETINNYNAGYWINNNEMLFTNDFEIWLYNLNSKQKELITRISAKINNAIMHENKGYIIYSTQKTINAIELDEREKRNVSELTELDYVGPLFVGPTGESFYFLGKIGDQQSLYKLFIQ